MPGSSRAVLLPSDWSWSASVRSKRKVNNCQSLRLAYSPSTTVNSASRPSRRDAAAVDVEGLHRDLLRSLPELEIWRDHLRDKILRRPGTLRRAHADLCHEAQTMEVSPSSDLARCLCGFAEVLWVDAACALDDCAQLAHGDFVSCGEFFFCLIFLLLAWRLIDQAETARDRGAGEMAQRLDGTVPPAAPVVPSDSTISGVLASLLNFGCFGLKDLTGEMPDPLDLIELAKNLSDIATDLKRVRVQKQAAKA